MADIQEFTDVDILDSRYAAAVEPLDKAQGTGSYGLRR